MNVGEVWGVKFPFDDEPSKFKFRPCIIIDVDKLEVLSVKVTTHTPRDEFDIPILNWRRAKLRDPSYARISKSIQIPKSSFVVKYGDIHKDDFDKIIETYVKFNSQ